MPTGGRHRVRVYTGGEWERMRKANFIAGIVLLAFSLLLLFWLIPTQVEEVFDGQVSPKLLPQICAIGIGLLSIVLIVTNARAPEGESGDDGGAPITLFEFRAMLVIASMLGLAIFLFTTTGPVVAALVMMTGIMFAMGERRVLPYVLMPAVLLGGSYVLFYKILNTAIV